MTPIRRRAAVARVTAALFASLTALAAVGCGSTAAKPRRSDVPGPASGAAQVRATTTGINTSPSTDTGARAQTVPKTVFHKPRLVHVSITADGLVPRHVIARRGEFVVWVNAGPQRRQVRASEPRFASPSLLHGSTFTYAAVKPGVIHYRAGTGTTFAGTITVAR